MFPGKLALVHFIGPLHTAASITQQLLLGPLLCPQTPVMAFPFFPTLSPYGWCPGALNLCSELLFCGFGWCGLECAGGWTSCLFVGFVLFCLNIALNIHCFSGMHILCSATIKIFCVSLLL